MYKKNSDAVLTKPTAPPQKNSGQLLWWVFSKPPLLDKYSNTLSRKQALWELLKAYPLVVACCCLLYLLSSTLVVGLDLPHLLPGHGIELASQPFDQHCLFCSYALFIEETVLKFALGLAWCLFCGLGLSFSWGFFLSLSLSLHYGIAWGLACGFGFGFFEGIAWGLAWGFACGYACCSARNWTESLTVGIVFGFVWGLALGLSCGLAWVFCLLLGLFMVLIYMGVMTCLF
jgi:hypothetical protein